MTQFALAKVDPITDDKIRRHLTPCPEHGLIQSAALHIFKESSGVFVLAPFGRSFDEVYLSAQRSVVDGLSPGQSDLFLALKDLVPYVTGIALWYGDDFLDLPSTRSWEDFFSALQRDLEEPALETYVSLFREHLD